MNAIAPITVLDTTLLQPSIDAAIKQAADAAASVSNIGALVVDNERAAIESGVVLKDLKNRKQAAETFRDSITKPLKALLDATKKTFDGHIDTIKAADAHVRNQVLAFRERQRVEAERIQREIDEKAAAERAVREAEAAEAARRAEALRAQSAQLQDGGSRLMAIAVAKSAERAEADAQAATAAALQVSAVPIVAAQSRIDGVATAKVLRFRIIDESLIPEQFWSRVLDTMAIRRHGIDTEGKAPVPGIEYWYEETLRV